MITLGAIAQLIDIAIKVISPAIICNAAVILSSARLTQMAWDKEVRQPRTDEVFALQAILVTSLVSLTQSFGSWSVPLLNALSSIHMVTAAILVTHKVLMVENGQNAQQMVSDLVSLAIDQERKKARCLSQEILEKLADANETALGGTALVRLTLLDADEDAVSQKF